MGAVRLGKIALRWCFDCNVPVIESKACGTCGCDTVQVDITPPGDFRPAFDHDLELKLAQVEQQDGTYVAVPLPPDRVEKVVA